MKKTVAEEKNTVDLVTDAMYSVSFLEVLAKEIFSSKKETMPVRDFYLGWLKSVGAPEPKMPFSLGIFAGYMFCGLLITKENWSDLLPATEIAKLDEDWGLRGIVCVDSKEANPNIAHFIRRLRNSIGHTNFSIQVPSVSDIHGDLDKIHDLTVWTFKDIDPRDATNTFEVSLTMRQIEFLIKKFHSIVHQTVRQKV